MRHSLIIAGLTLIAALALTGPAAAYQPGYPVITGQTSGITGPDINTSQACLYASNSYYRQVSQPQGLLIAASRGGTNATHSTAGERVSAHRAICWSDVRFTNYFGLRDRVWFVGYAYGYGSTVTGIRQESRTCQFPITASPKYC